MYFLTEYWLVLGNKIKIKNTTLSEQFQSPIQIIETGKINTPNTHMTDDCPGLLQAFE